LLLLLSPNYEWYFLVVMPFVALCGNAPTWAATIGAILLTNEVETDFHISTMLVKSTLFGAVLLSALWSLRPAKATAA
jgi:alpha-1,6-mannosyltransferase